MAPQNLKFIFLDECAFYSRTGCDQEVRYGLEPSQATRYAKYFTYLYYSPLILLVVLALTGCGGGDGPVFPQIGFDGSSGGADGATRSLDQNSSGIPGGVLSLQLDSSGNHMLQVSGMAQLGGTLELNFSDDYEPVTGQSFTVVKAAGGVRGSFAKVMNNRSFKLSARQDANNVFVIVD